MAFASNRRMKPIDVLEASLTGLSLLLFGLITGFFYAYSCSVMFGLDASDPRHAIAAMQGINREVRNLMFAPSFFGTPVAAALTAGLLYLRDKNVASLAFGSASLLYVSAAMFPTFLINVPMNDALAKAAIPENLADANALWQAYSSRWTWWNGFRTAASAASLLLAAYGLHRTSITFGL